MYILTKYTFKEIKIKISIHFNLEMEHKDIDIFEIIIIFDYYRQN